MKKSFFGLLMVLLVLVAMPVVAQQQKGDSELQIQGALFIGGDTDSGAAFGNWGKFYSNKLELGLNLGLFFDADGDITGIAGPFARWNFGTGTTVPYVGIAATTSFGDFASGDVLLNFEAGARFFLTRNVAFNVAGLQSYDIDSSDLSDITTVVFGFSYLWEK